MGGDLGAPRPCSMSFAAVPKGLGAPAGRRRRSAFDFVGLRGGQVPRCPSGVDRRVPFAQRGWYFRGRAVHRASTDASFLYTGPCTSGGGTKSACLSRSWSGRSLKPLELRDPDVRAQHGETAAILFRYLNSARGAELPEFHVQTETD